MVRKKASALISSLTLCLLTGLANAQVCPTCTIPPVIISPDLSIPYDVFIRDSAGDPILGANVEIKFPLETCDLLVLCGHDFEDCDNRVFSQTTDANGRARFLIRGGGCWDEVACPSPAYLVKVYVNGSKYREVGVRSPDVIAGGQQLTTCQLWCTAPLGSPGEAAVTLGDIVWFTPHLKSGSNSPCADIDGSGVAGLADAVLITPAVKGAAMCSELP